MSGFGDGLLVMLVYVCGVISLLGLISLAGQAWGWGKALMLAWLDGRLRAGRFYLGRIYRTASARNNHVFLRKSLRWPDPPARP